MLTSTCRQIQRGKMMLQVLWQLRNVRFKYKSVYKVILRLSWFDYGNVPVYHWCTLIIYVCVCICRSLFLIHWHQKCVASDLIRNVNLIVERFLIVYEWTCVNVFDCDRQKLQFTWQCVYKIEMSTQFINEFKFVSVTRWVVCHPTKSCRQWIWSVLFKFSIEANIYFAKFSVQIYSSLCFSAFNIILFTFVISFV